MSRFGLIFVLALTGVLACDSDDGPGGDGDAGPAMDASASGGDGGAGGTGGSAGTGGSSGTGGSAGTGGSTGDDDAGMEPTVDGGGGTGGAGGGTGGLPVDGSRLAVCYEDDDCTDPLRCSRYGNNAGFCVEACNNNDKDCSDIDGVQTTCGSDGVCRIDCGPDGSDGACPDDMECAEITSGFPIGSTVSRCQYPAGSGAKDVGPYGECDATRGDADCMDGLECQPETGMCVGTCMDEGDCPDPGTNATPVCDKPNVLAAEGTCGLQCANNDKDCPGNLTCQSPGLLGLGGVLTGMRCAVP